MADNYTIPLGIDPKIFGEIDRMEQQLGALSSSAKNAGNSLTNVLTDSAQKGDLFNEKLLVSTANINKIQQAAKQAGTDLEKAFSKDRIKTSELDAKVTQFVTKLKDAIGKPVDFKFNLDAKTVTALNSLLGQAKGQIQQFELVLETANKELAGIDKGSTQFKILSQQIQDADRFLNVLKEDAAELPGGNVFVDLGDSIDEVKPKAESFKAQLKQMKEELIGLELAGKGNTEEFRQLAIKAGELSDQIQDTSQRVKEVGSDTKGIDAIITGVRGLAGAFAVAQGALAAFGAQDEEAAQAIQKVQGAMAILQGVQEISNVLNKDSALVVYLDTFARKGKTTAVVAETVALEGEVVATEAATVATEGFTAALLLNPIVLIVAAILAASVAIYKYATASESADKILERLNRNIQYQNQLLDENDKILQRSQNVQEANKGFLRKNQSEILASQIEFLKAQLNNEQTNFAKIADAYETAKNNKKISFEEFEKISKQYNDAYAKTLDTQSKITVAGINLQRQQQDEQVKLELDFLKEKQLQANTAIAISKQTQDFVNQIANIKLSELRDGEAKEIGVLKQSTAEKIKALDDEAKAKLKNLNDTRTQLFLELKVADENGKKIIEQQISDNARQITLEKQSGQKRIELKKTLTEAELIEEQKIRTKYAQEERDFLFDVDVKLNSLRKESADKEIALLELTKNHELDLIERTNKSQEDKEIASLAIVQEFEKKKQDTLLEFNLRKLDLDKTSNENLLMAQKDFFDKSRDGQALSNLLLLQNELETEKKKLELLKESGKNLSDQEVINAQNRILKLQDQIKTATKNAKATNIYELLFPGDDKGQKLAKAFMRTLNEVGNAVQEYTTMLINQYQMQIDAQEKKISKDDDAIKSLQDQLDREQELKDKGLANNVDAIKADIEQQKQLREKDIKERDEAQKKLEKVQKAQAAAQTVLQVANLVTASTEIYLSLAQLGPIGVGIASVTIAAMFAAFAASKMNAANATKQNFGDGGEIDGKSHDEGGRKYYDPKGGGVVELEGGEFVTNKRSTKKYKSLLRAINEDNLDDFKIAELLSGLGIHLQAEEDQNEALKESRIHTSNIINYIAPPPPISGELISINENVAKLVDNANNAINTWEDDAYIYTKKGNRITKRRKK